MKIKKAKIKVNEDDCLKVNPSLIEKILGNEDLLMEILLRVPAKSLVKLKCVSKHWLSLISDLKFCYKHSAQSLKLVSAIYYYSDPCCSRLKSLSLEGHQNLPTLPLFDGVEKGYTISVTHACNGLMLCSRRWWHEEYFCVCNLTTNKYTVILKAPSSSNHVLLACISYDPVKSPYYKVVLTRYPNLVDIYFSENNSWKRIQVTEALCESHHKAFWDESIHWIHYGNAHLKLDVEKETLEKITVPPKLSFLMDHMIHYFGECGESLILIQYRPRAIVGFRILEMRKGSTSWTVKQRANLRPIMQLHPENKEFHVLNVLKGLLESDVVLVLAAAHKIFMYDLSSKRLEVICDFTPSEFWDLQYYRNDCSGRAYHFIESLAPV